MGIGAILVSGQPSENRLPQQTTSEITIPIMQLIITARDQVLARYGNQLAALGEGQARTTMSRALNHEGDKGRTQVKRAWSSRLG